MWKWLFRKRSIRSALLATVNTAMVLAFSVVLVWHYRAGISDVISARRASLNAEALAVHYGVLHQLRTHGPDSAERFLNEVRSRATNENPRDHKIEVLIDSGLQTNDGSVETHEFSAQSLRKPVATEYVTGRFASDGLAVNVSESVTSIRRAARSELLVQVGFLGLIGLVAAVLVNSVLARIVNAPLLRLKESLEQIAEGNFDTQIDPTGSTEMQQLARSVNSVSVQLSQADRQRRWQMQRARRIQEHLLPNGVRIPGLESCKLFIPADEVGGDYYDFLPLSDGTWIICIADVTGHGVPAAMEAAMLKSLLVTAADGAARDPDLIFREVNRQFARTASPSDFASMFLARWDPQTADLTYASAGHEPALLVTAGGDSTWLPSTGLLLGVQEDVKWDRRSITLQPDDRLLLFSDGATEAQSPNGVLFGRDRLAGCFSGSRELTLKNALARIRCAIDEHADDERRTDDLTLIAFACVIPESALHGGNRDMGLTDDARSF